jgi:outer membrane protein TolC
MKRALMIIAVAAVAAAPASVTSAAGERELTLEQALDIAKKRNKNMAVDRARLAQVQTTLSSAWALLLPNIAAQGRYTRNYAEFAVHAAGPACR